MSQITVRILPSPIGTLVLASTRQHEVLETRVSSSSQMHWRATKTMMEVRALYPVGPRVVLSADSKAICCSLGVTGGMGSLIDALRYEVEVLRDLRRRVLGTGDNGSATDIGDAKLRQAQLGEEISLPDQMVGILGHDLKNPLNAVAGAAGAMLMRGRLSEEDRRCVYVVQRAARRMSEMIETLLDFARVRYAGGLPISPAPADLTDVVEEVRDEACAARPDRAIEIELRGDLRGQWDRARVQQALANLVANAQHHGDPLKPPHVSADGLGEEVVLAVRNEGPPIPPELMEVLFEPFKRGTSGKAPVGLGLGLYIVKQIAVAHGGTIDVESSAENGTTFSLRLPRGSPRCPAGTASDC
jgi:signal transduction histidine kinase